MINQSCQHKQKIRKPIQISNDDLVHCDIDSQRHHPALRTPADRPSDMKKRTRLATACQDKLTQRRQFGFELIDGRFKNLDSA
jgi:hypothetical protein